MPTKFGSIGKSFYLLDHEIKIVKENVFSLKNNIKNLYNKLNDVI